MEQRRPLQARAERRRELALRTTLELIRGRGIGAVTLRGIADAAGIPLGSLTYYFPSKEELLVEALNLWVEEETAKVVSLADEIEARDLSRAAAAARCAEVLQSYDPEQIAQYELYLHAARSPRLQGAVEAAFGVYDAAVAAALGAAGVEDSERLAPLFVALADGLGMRRVAAPEGSPDLGAALIQALDLLDGAEAGE